MPPLFFRFEGTVQDLDRMLEEWTNPLTGQNDPVEDGEAEN